MTSAAALGSTSTQPPYNKHYNMLSYVTKELPGVVQEHFPINPSLRSVFGHSMGGHGALTLFMKHPNMYRSVSAFSPICHPTDCPWGKKAFAGYLGDNKDAWKAHDATVLAETYKGDKPEILVDQGLADPFLAEQLKPEALEAACERASWPLRVRRHEGYTHSYYFISSFVADHIAHHARFLA